jgi:hypothetical protein
MGGPVAHSFVEKLAEVAFAAMANGRQLVLELHTIREGWNETVQARRGAAAWPQWYVANAHTRVGHRGLGGVGVERRGGRRLGRCDGLRRRRGQWLFVRRVEVAREDRIIAV